MTALEPNSLQQELVAVRRDLHQHPELSWQEERTAQCVESFLKRYHIDHQRVTRTGVVAEIAGCAMTGEQGDEIVALRADLDALPIQEETGLSFASIHDGRMHACGHDAHTAMLLGGAVMLMEGPPLVRTVRLIFQPAEEVGEGARAMMDAGALDEVAMIFGGHVDRHFNVGTIVVTDGPVNASTDTFHIRVHGQSAHAARPHEGVDAVVVAMLIVSTLQTIVSREINPAHPGVVTIGRLVAGTAANVIAGEALLEGTVRAQEPAVRQQLLAAVDRMCTAAGQLHGAIVDFSVWGATPPVINPPGPTALARAAAQDIVGADSVCPLTIANMGAEDFGNYVAEIPGCYVRFGSQVAGHEGYPAHSSRFDVDERVLGIGAAWFEAVARRAATHLAEGPDCSSSEISAVLPPAE